MDDIFITYTTEILGDTHNGLTGSEIAKYCSSFAIKFNVTIPFPKYPFPKKAGVPNKRTALKSNIDCFDDEQKFIIIKWLCELPKFVDNKDIQKVKETLLLKYSHLSKEKLNNTELIKKTQHWLSNYPLALTHYNNGLTRYEQNIFQRNVIDDMRLSLELLVKSLLDNQKSLENNISEIGSKLKCKNISSHLRQMVPKLIDYYTKYQNNHIKHINGNNESESENEIEFIIEFTSIVMKFLIKNIN